jgi:hypothetical protein
MLGEGHSIIMSGRQGIMNFTVVIEVVPTEEVEHLFAEGEALLELLA